MDGGKGMLAAHLCLDLRGLKRIRLYYRQGEVGGTLPVVQMSWNTWWPSWRSLASTVQ